MIHRRGKPTKAWIDSPACDWPKMVKHLAKEIIDKRAALAKLHKEYVAIDMLDPRKIQMSEDIARAMIELAAYYSYLGKELAYHRSITQD